MKILKLTFGELLKQTKKISFKVCLIILLAFAIGLPILYKTLVFEDTNSTVYDDSVLYFHKASIIEKPKTDDDMIFNDLNNTMIKVIEKSRKLEKEREVSDFKRSLYDEYANSMLNSVCLDYKIKNKDVDYERVDQEFVLNCISYSDLNKTDLIKIKKETNAKSLKILNSIKENNYANYLKEELKNLKTLEQSGITDYKIKVYEKLLSLKITDDSDFRVREANSIIENYNSTTDILSKTSYNKGSGDKNITYDEYVKLTKLKNKQLEDSIKKSWYAIDNNIDYNKSGVKDAFIDSIKNNTIFLSIIIVIIAGGIVSNEFQKGTIRLLVTKPNKRWKILFSKFLAVLCILLGLTLITAIASFVTNGILFGFKDYFTSDLLVVNNSVKEVSYLTVTFGKMALLLIPIIFIGLFAFCLSSVTRNTAFSVGVSIFLFVGYAIILLLFTTLGIPYLDLTFFPYLDYTQFLDSDVLVDNCYTYDIYYTLTKSNLVLTFWAILIYFISNLAFVKRDIKN